MIFLGAEFALFDVLSSMGFQVHKTIDLFVLISLFFAFSSPYVLFRAAAHFIIPDISDSERRTVEDQYALGVLLGSCFLLAASAAFGDIPLLRIAFI